jgi:predicted amidohydrolase
LHTICVLYEVNTQHIQFQSLATRINNLTAAVEAASAYVDRALTPGGFSPLRAIFLAPEYLFSRAIAAALPSQTSSGFRKIRFGVERRGEQKWGERRQMGEEETVKLRVRFASLSTAFTNALLIPGSVAWRKLIASQQAQVKYQNRIKATTNINALETKGQIFTRYTKVFPESAESELRYVHSPLDKFNYLETATYAAKNTAHCCFNGATIFKYNKIGDFHEVQDGPDTVHIPAVEAGRFAIPSVPSLSFGIAICYDQSLSAQFDQEDGRLWSGNLQYTQAAVDLHVLLSACIEPHLQNSHLKPGGYLLSCLSRPAFNRVIRQGTGDLKPMHGMEVGGSKMEFFLLKTPNPPGTFSLRVFGSSPDDSLRLDYRIRAKSTGVEVMSGKLGSLGVVDVPNLGIENSEINFPGQERGWTGVKAGNHYMLSSGRYSFQCD